MMIEAQKSEFSHLKTQPVVLRSRNWGWEGGQTWKRIISDHVHTFVNMKASLI